MQLFSSSKLAHLNLHVVLAPLHFHNPRWMGGTGPQGGSGGSQRSSDISVVKVVKMEYPG